MCPLPVACQDLYYYDASLQNYSLNYQKNGSVYLHKMIYVIIGENTTTLGNFKQVHFEVSPNAR